MVYVPFNEPDWIWYGLSTSNQTLYRERMARFLEHWRIAVGYIRQHHPSARIMGPNQADFIARNYRDFLAYGHDHGVLPDFVSWHQLPSASLANYRDRYTTYREIEASLGIDPIPVNINEHAGNRDLTVPGQMVQRVPMFEDTKVDAGGKAYWTVAGSLAGDVVQTNQPGGGWWFYKMYADMTSDTVRVTPPQPSVIDTLQGMASVDHRLRQAHIVAGGTAEPFDVVIENIGDELFGDTVHVTLSATTWSGQDAAAPPPVVLHEADHPVGDGSLTVPVRGLGVQGDGGVNVDRMAAYEIVLSPGGSGTRAPVALPWRASYEAENAQITNGQAVTHGTVENWNAAAASGTQDVGFLTQPDSAVTFTVDVPVAGDYRLGILYGNQTGMPSQQVLTVNGAAGRFVYYPATLHWQYRARADEVVTLRAGTNEIRLGKSHPEVGTAVAEATLDRIDLELVGDGEPAVRSYQAERAQPDGPAAYRYDQPGQSGAGHLLLRSSAETTFAVFADRDGYYDLEFRHSSPGLPGRATAQISLDRRPVDGAVLRTAPGGRSWTVERERLFLSAGINRVTVAARGGAPVRLDELVVTGTDAGPVQRVEAEDATLAGSAAVQASEHASSGQYVGWIGNGPANRLTFEVDVPAAGDYLLVVDYANNERGAGHQYNANVISRPIDVSVNGDAPTRHWLKNTWSWGNFWSRTVPVTLEAGSNSIAIFNDPANAATDDSVWAPDLDRFTLAPVRAG
jgi:hypothetical protein